MSDLFHNPQKMQFIKEFESEPKPGNTKDAIPFLMKYAKIAQSRNLRFDKDEIQELAARMCTNLDENDQKRIQNLLKYIR